MSAFLMLLFHFLVGHQVLTFMHELGHALPILLFTQENVIIELGKQPPQRSWVLGRLRLNVQLPSYAGLYRYDKEEVSRDVILLSLAGGPVTSLLLTAVFGVAAALLRSRSEPSLWQTFFIILAADALLLFVLTAVPLKYPAWYGLLAGWPSDGYQIREMLRDGAQK